MATVETLASSLFNTSFVFAGAPDFHPSKLCFVGAPDFHPKKPRFLGAPDLGRDSSFRPAFQESFQTGVSFAMTLSSIHLNGCKSITV
jgi:hypothetical protein